MVRICSRRLSSQLSRPNIPSQHWTRLRKDFTSPFFTYQIYVGSLFVLGWRSSLCPPRGNPDSWIIAVNPDVFGGGCAEILVPRLLRTRFTIVPYQSPAGGPVCMHVPTIRTDGLSPPIRMRSDVGVCRDFGPPRLPLQQISKNS